MGRAFNVVLLLGFIGTCCGQDDVRLVGGSGPNEGRVEVFIAGEWGTICDDLWGINDAQVVCRQLGYSGAVMTRDYAFFGQGSGRIWLDNVECTGDEESLANCPKNDIADHNCQHYEDAGVECQMQEEDSVTEAAPVIEDIRLAGGTTGNEGRVEVFMEGVWGTVCDDSFDQNDADVVCRQLGYTGASYYRTSAFFGHGEGPIWLDNVECTGSEQSLEVCQKNIGEENCDHADDAGVGCIIQDTSPGTTPAPPVIQDIRLADGHTVNMGRVEVQVNGVWGTVCDDLWDMNDATVTCKQLGFPGAESVRKNSYFGTGSSIIWLDNVECVGDEATLDECPKNDIGNEDCGGSEHAGVVCHPYDTPPANRWRADYRCGSGEFYAPNGKIAGCDPQGTNPCCSPFHWCGATPSHCECGGCIDYRVTTTAIASPIIEDIRLADGTTVNMGRVEVMVNGVWGTVCDDLWDIDDATVTCKQLGYPGAEAARRNSYFGTGSDTIWLDNVECVGDETTLHECPKNDIGDEDCGGSEHAGVVCLPWETPPASSTNHWRADYRCGGEFYAPNGEIAECDPEGTNPCCSPYNWCDVTSSHCECEGCIDYRFFTGYQDIRLNGGPSENEGRVEVLVNGEWGTVCDDVWGLDDATVACKELGYPGAELFFTYSHFGGGTGSTWLDNVECTGNEESLNDCQKNRIGDHNCGHDEDAGVKCTPEATPDVDGDVRLVGGNETAGRVEVYIAGVWGTVCDDSWDLIDADVVCRQLGFQRAISAPRYAAFGPGVDPIYFDDLDCIGYEENLLECPSSTYVACGHSEDASAVCLSHDIPETGGGYQDIRLTGGQSENEGRVEVLVNGEWGTVCDDFWDLEDATVACKELGYPGAEIFLSNSHFGGGTGVTWLDDVECSGKEETLNYCQKNRLGVHNCGHDEDAGVKCTTPVIGQVRLAGGSETAGRVEVYWEGEWGTVCDNGWDIEDANIVCNQLGFPSAQSALSGAAFGEGSGPVHFDYVACFGGEPDLLRCSRSALPISCLHDQDAGVSCWDEGYIDAERGTEQPPPPTCEPLQSSLCQGMPYNLTAFPNAAGFTTQEEAEITLSYTFQAVIPMGCTAGFFQFMCLHFMSPCETTGVPTIPCKELCETGIKGCFALMEASSFPVPPLDLDCSLLPDEESGLCFAEDTSRFPYEARTTTVPTAIVDSGRSTLVTPVIQDIRLVNGYSHFSGRVEVYVSGEWGTICHDKWTREDADVACRWLGYTGADVERRNAFFGEGTGPIWLDNVRCNGDELTLNECRMWPIGEHNCGHTEDAGVECTIVPTPFGPRPVGKNIRLVSGNATAGRVEVLVDGVWGTVCDDYWDLQDAMVVCRQLGFPGAISVLTGVPGLLASNPILLNDVQCTGGETDLLRCNYSSSHNCNHLEDAGVVCSTVVLPDEEQPYIGNIRLMDGNDTAGRVEIYLYGAWGTVCDDSWDLRDADVVCRQLGFPGAISAPTLATFGPGSDPIFLDDVECSGEETDLLSCRYSLDDNCSHREDAGVVCNSLSTSVTATVSPSQAPPSVTQLQLADGNETGGRVEIYLAGMWGTVCDDYWDLSDANVVCRQLGFPWAISAPEEVPNIGQLRLVGGDDDSTGSVEIYLDGVWGTICKDLWDLLDAKVVCRQLGFPGVFSAPRYAAFGPRSEPFHLDDVECTGEETDLLSCSHTRDISCGNYGVDAGVVCSRTPNAVGKKIRLVSGNATAGRVEVLVGGVWGTVCDDYWDLQDAMVACRQLGFPGAISVLSGVLGVLASDPILMDDVQCTGRETELLRCSYSSSSNCNHFEDAGVVCSTVVLPDEEQPYIGNIRLIDGNDTAGRVEIYLDSAWGTVCDDSWDLRDADVVCRQLGFPGAISAPILAAFGPGSDPIHLDDVECSGEETDLLSCRYSLEDNCSHGEDAGVICNSLSTSVTATPSPVIEDIRLAEGRTVNMGRVEVMINGVWGTVCDDFWDMNDATVTCKQLGYPGAEAARQNSHFGIGSDTIWLDNVECEGDETTLDECPKNDIGDENCGESEHAGVVCLAWETPPASATNRWRADYRCGGEFYAPNGDIAECNPEGTNPCCSPYNWCDITPSHCKCEGCIDYRVTATPSPVIEDIRLAEGRTVNMGRVEVMINGMWGTVCDDFWDMNDATVTCKQLGYPGAEAARQNSYFGTGSDTIWLDNVECEGDETTLDECPKNDIGDENCGESEHAGVVCLAWETPPASATNRWRADYRCGGEFYAPNGDIAECNPEGTNPCCSPYNWCDITPSHCKCEGCIDYRVTDVTSPNAWRDDYQCGGDYLAPNGEVAQCDPEGIYPCCSPYNWCGITADHCDCAECIDYRVTRIDDIRLADGPTENQGRVEVLVKGEWGTVCDDGWGMGAAAVVCRELGFAGVEDGTTYEFFRGDGPIWVDNLFCLGDEESLNDCEKNKLVENDCSHGEDVGVICISTSAPSTSPTPVIGQVRLAGGSETAGRVEVYWEGEWGTVCDNGWDIEDANIVCNQLGFPSALSALSEAAFGEGSGPVHFDYVACFGGEPDLLRCSRSAVPISCLHDQDAGVSCRDKGYVDAGGGTEEPLQPTCEPLQSSLCRGMPYNLTTFPNDVGHTTQEEAERGLSLTFQTIIPLGCPAGFFQFMCLQFMPPCETIGVPTIPCKELCETGIKECYAIIEAAGVPVPPIDLDCSLLPAEGTGLCFAEDPSGLPYEDPNQDYRNDYKCGGDFLAPNGEVARCQKDGQYPCCSPAKWCGITSDHCDCAECIDYRYHD